MDPKHLHDTRKKLNDLAISHNRLTTLSACLLNEVQALKKELNEMKGIKTVQTSNNSPNTPSQNNRMPPQNNNNMRNMNNNNMRNNTNNNNTMNQFRYDPNNIVSLQADEILKQLTIHHE